MDTIIKFVAIVLSGIIVIGGGFMKRFIIGVAGLCMFMCITANVFAGGAKAKVIKAIPTTISVSGVYTLGANLISASSTTDAITVNADNVIIDMAGYGIKGTGIGEAHGIIVNGKGVEIRNGSVSGFYNGIIGNNGGVRIINVKVPSIYQYAIYINGDGNRIKDCTVTGGNATGIVIQSNGNIISGNTVYGEAYSSSGIYSGGANYVSSNTVFSNTGSGIIANAGSAVLGNTVHDNSVKGINNGAGNALINGNAVYGNAGGNMATGAGTVTGINLAP